MLDTATLALEVTANTFVNFLRKNFHVTEEAAYGYICAKRRNHAYGNTNSKIDKAVKAGIIKKNTAARNKSKLMKAINNIK